MLAGLYLFLKIQLPSIHKLLLSCFRLLKSNLYLQGISYTCCLGPLAIYLVQLLQSCLRDERETDSSSLHSNLLLQLGSYHPLGNIF